MTTFILKISGKNIYVVRDRKEIGDTDDFKEALHYVATLIKKEKIRKFEVYASYRGGKELLEDFDPMVILKDNGGLMDLDDDDDSDNDNDSNDSSRHRNFSGRDDSRSKRGFVYTPTLNGNDYANLGLRLRDALDNSNQSAQE